ncbi:hypothetical protein GGTG_05416 [Gaeumannomyces tritici R3-111a-1]|uniref:Threonylcarbamoyl-AMP synthase n=1 Tax=Gaeumannomyces tritici (strain R3-111a-1) TaxID=644352 RepID=J3NVV4_GAET3|nr:hypothetical protein GGTG_05416 [Gaeumannomyces tritici R3-111a-1]EJT75483.1 hypothetical protein GGTG_05416 [Gaeumannomyces tritici R3-111a-1]
MKTEVVRVDPAAAASLGRFREVVVASSNGTGSSSSNISITPIQNLASWELAAAPSSGPSGDAHVDADEHPALGPLRRAAERLRSSDVPVAFPTETVYGLGADATRSAAVRGIYAAKGRPSDNPLIVHVCDLDMLRSLLVGATPNDDSNSYDDPIPPIYLPLLQRFWPGPLTILLRNPTPPPPASRRLAPEMILDGGPCGVGVESTVVDGLSDPPAVLRPGGVGIEEIRACPGWEGVVRAYRDEVQVGAAAAPRAPGMKYKHYSPRARVVLYEGGFGADDGAWEAGGGAGRRIGVVRTRSSAAAAGSLGSGSGTVTACGEDGGCALRFTERERRDADGGATTVLETSLGRDPRHVAQGLFSALRELDARRADVIFVEGVGDGDDIAAAVMNRLRKAASEVR